MQAPFFNTGLYNVDGDGGYPPHDQGLYDGSKATLRDVLEHYRAGGTHTRH